VVSTTNSLGSRGIMVVGRLLVVMVKALSKLGVLKLKFYLLASYFLSINKDLLLAQSATRNEE